MLCSLGRLLIDLRGFACSAFPSLLCGLQDLTGVRPSSSLLELGTSGEADPKDLLTYKFSEYSSIVREFA